MLLEYGNIRCGSWWKVEEKAPPGYSRVYYVYGGEVFYRDKLDNIYLKPGYLYIFPSASAYCMKQNPRDSLYCTYMHIDFFPSVLKRLVEIPIENTPALKHLLFSIKECIAVKDIKLINILSDVFIIYCKEHQYISLPDNQISNILLYIAGHIDQKISVKNLSSLAGYNDQYFIRLFKRNVGVTPYQYIVSYRLKEAKKLLNTDKSISRIAKMTGYSDIKSFSRAFKNNYGLSPSVYRDAYVSQP